MSQQKKIRKKAEELATMPYYINIIADKVDDEILYVAMNPELEGCLAQGFNPQEAVDNLNEVRIDYIQHLLEHNISIPEPNHDSGYKLYVEAEGPGVTISSVAFDLKSVEVQTHLPKQEGTTIEQPKKFEFV